MMKIEPDRFQLDKDYIYEVDIYINGNKWNKSPVGDISLVDVNGDLIEYKDTSVWPYVKKQVRGTVELVHKSTGKVSRKK